jgi:Linear amide C-N hydrolases, choloylglycine hydrolase family
MLRDSEAKLMTKIYVWGYSQGRLFLNYKNLKKTALVPEGADPVQWVSKYPSITFNQVAEHFPIGGMNSEGLGVEVLLGPADWPLKTEKKAISELQWMQRLLDTSANLEEAIAAAKSVDILHMGSRHLHYHVCDKAGHCGVFEYDHQELKIRSPDALTVANGSIFDMSYTPDALERGMKDYYMQKFPNPQAAVDGVFDLVRRRFGYGLWTIVYELANGRATFRYGYPGIRRMVDLKRLQDPSRIDCRFARKDPSDGRYYALRLDLDPRKAQDLPHLDFGNKADDDKLLDDAREMIEGYRYYSSRYNDGESYGDREDGDYDGDRSGEHATGDSNLISRVRHYKENSITCVPPKPN